MDSDFLLHSETARELYGEVAALPRLAGEYAPDCLIRPDHTPTMAGESNENLGYTVQGNLFAVGYIRGILDTLKEGNAK